MEIFFEIIKNVIVVLLSAVQLAMLVRAVLSWFVMDENKIVNFLYAVTEPFIVPVRLLFEKLNWFQNSPIDFSFMITYLIISIIIIILP
ncbi:MAG: YggT family protein [Clostridia bacterium]|nr:YggT family protein [Clostridia bacterium]